MTCRRHWMTLGSVLLLVIASCGGSEGAGDQLQIVASTSIVGALAEEVAGEHAEVTVLMEPGTDPHTYEVTTSDARAIEGADLVLINGLELDNGLIENAGVDSSGVTVVEISRNIEALLSSDDEHDDAVEDSEHDEHEHGDTDPHVWMDPLRVQVMVGTIAEALSEVDPDNADDYRSNADAYSQVLEETHQEILALVEQIPADRRKLLTNHDSFSYFAERYGFEVVGTVIPGTSTESEPSARDIADLHELIEHEGVTVIFAEQLVDPKVSEQLAGDTGAVIVYGLYTGQLGEPDSPAGTLDGMLLENARTITGALTSN